MEGPEEEGMYYVWYDELGELTPGQYVTLLMAARRHMAEQLNPKQQRELKQALEEANKITNLVELVTWIVDCDEQILYYKKLQEGLIEIRRSKGL